MEIEKGEVITLTDNKEYVCLSIIVTEDNKRFLYLVTTTEPVSFCFAEETIENDAIKLRKVGGKDEKHKLFDLLKSQVQTNSNRGEQHV